MTREGQGAIFLITIALSTVQMSAMYVKGSDWPGGAGFVTFHAEKLNSAEITTDTIIESSESHHESHSSLVSPSIQSNSKISSIKQLTSSSRSNVKEQNVPANHFSQTRSSDTLSLPDVNLNQNNFPKNGHSGSSSLKLSTSTESSKPDTTNASQMVSPIPLPESQTTSPPRRRRTTSGIQNRIIKKHGFLPIFVHQKSDHLIKPLYHKQKLAKPTKVFDGIYEWKNQPSKERNDDDDKRSTLLILPLLATFIFIFAAIGRCINWCTEDVRIADSKHKHYIEPDVPLNFLRSYNSSLRSAYSHPGTPTGVPSVPSPLLSRNSSGRSTKSLRTPEHRRRKQSVNLSADDVRKIDQRHRRPPALAARTASGSALQRQISNNSLRRQVHLDKNKAHWGVQFEKKRRESDASSGIATTQGSTTKIKFDISPQKEVSSPSSQGYVSNSESFCDAASLPCSCKTIQIADRVPKLTPLNSAGQINNSDLNLARALLQLQRLSLGVSFNVGAPESLSLRSESACSTTVSSPPIMEHENECNPFLGQRHMFPDPVDAAFEMDVKDENNQDVRNVQTVVSKLTLENVASMSSSPGCDEMHGMVATPSNSTADDSPSTVMAPTFIGSAQTQERSLTAHRVKSETLLQHSLYEEDPLLCAVQRISRSRYFHKKLQRMTSDDDALCHSSGLSSKHSSYCSDEGEQSLSLSGSLRFVFDNCGSSSPWTSIDHCQSPCSSVSSGAGVSPQLYTTATIHPPPSRKLERQDSVASSPSECPAPRARHVPRRRREAQRHNTTSLTALRRLHSKELLQRISKITQPGYPSRNKKKTIRLNQCHSWCGPGTMESQAF